MIQEGVRAYYAGGWYDEVVTHLPVVAEGMVSAPSGAGLGARLRPEFLARPDVVSRVSSHALQGGIASHDNLGVR
jgi:L-alanine-DL-glutamate epimerase-like enolase superfamily enzyme